MVVLAASIISKSGKALVSRQYVDMSRIRIEGLLAAFPKLVGTGKQHTYLETESVRYVYQPIEGLYLLLITNKQSNILEDLDTLRLLSKLQMEKGKLDKGGYSSISGPRVIEKTFSDMNISGTGFGSGSGLSGIGADMDSFASKPKGRPSAAATAPGKGFGMKLGKSQKTNQFLESLKAEGEVILEDVQPSAVSSRSSPLIPSDPITVTIEEKLNVIVKRDGGVNNFDVQGTLALQVLNDADGFIQLQIENKDVPGLSFKTHPNIHKELFNSQQIVGAKDPNRPFPSGQNETPLVKWRIQGMNESDLPLSVNCWPSVSGNETYVNIEYEASEMFDLNNVVISIPLPALREAPTVKQIDGEWKYDSRNSALEWSIILIDQSNRSGSMEFIVPPADPSTFFPISIGFAASNTFSDLKVTGIHPLKEGNPPKYSQRVRLVAANYQIV
ncbi:unnamed protein product [Triticum turgidum subsp. durum]|uniref:Coatomer subunit delta n=1 Tax=Triticum turgidum subsp. durum TaxID=4567 RepID=A0A9R0VAN7_TRITD|nr:unnamed protein product [Triticum turgidum subsp. durum]